MNGFGRLQRECIHKCSEKVAARVIRFDFAQMTVNVYFPAILKIVCENFYGDNLTVPSK